MKSTHSSITKPAGSSKRPAPLPLPQPARSALDSEAKEAIRMVECRREWEVAFAAAVAEGRLLSRDFEKLTLVLRAIRSAHCPTHTSPTLDLIDELLGMAAIR